MAKYLKFSTKSEITQWKLLLSHQYILLLIALLCMIYVRKIKSIMTGMQKLNCLFFFNNIDIYVEIPKVPIKY